MTTIAAVRFILFKEALIWSCLVCVYIYAYLLYIISQYWARLRYLSGFGSSSGSGLHP